MAEKEYNPNQILRDYKKEINRVFRRLHISYSQFKTEYPHLAEALDSYESEHKVNLATRGMIRSIGREEAEERDRIFR